jgi:hypothetical protein
MELENIILSKVSQVRRPKITCSPSYVDYRPTTNAVMLLDRGHINRRMGMEGIEKGRET